MTGSFVLRGGRVIDPANGVDRVAAEWRVGKIIVLNIKDAAGDEDTTGDIPDKMIKEFCGRKKICHVLCVSIIVV